MARVKRGVTAGRRHKKILEKAKGYYNARRKVFRAAKQAVIKAGQYAYPRPPRRRSASSARCGSRASTRRRVCTACPTAGSSTACCKAGIEVDRKMLADIAVHDAAAFGAIAEQAKAALAKAA